MTDVRVILVVDDDADTRARVRTHLTQDGFRIREASTVEEALAGIAADTPALTVLELVLPDASGLELCRQLRADPRFRSVPLVMLSGRATEVDRVLAFELGVDDFLAKPFSARELSARIRAVLRRTQPRRAASELGGREVFARGRLRVDFDRYEVTVDGARADLSPREFQLLRFFVEHPYRAYDRLQLLDRVWGRDSGVEARTVDAHVRRLRKHLERDDSAPELLLTVRGVGYKFVPDALDAARR